MDGINVLKNGARTGINELREISILDTGNTASHCSDCTHKFARMDGLRRDLLRGVKALREIRHLQRTTVLNYSTPTVP
ncbi:hypothetical protein KIN20_033774 [Parelaphostrongylus tenuis]|uniref:Uncharacterized protein n=1 Tax=Parelaphostrongylus tenuis TaxID=148309 RepID=A0AAD5R910_PARTN|nr:hypothetical protein KIN20_033774 [Parelaphostrongylus tenuis]